MDTGHQHPNFNEVTRCALVSFKRLDLGAGDIYRLLLRRRSLRAPDRIKRQLDAR